MLYDALVFLVVALIAGCLGLNCSSAVFSFSSIEKRLAPYAHNYAKDKKCPRNEIHAEGAGDRCADIDATGKYSMKHLFSLASGSPSVC